MSRTGTASAVRRRFTISFLVYTAGVVSRVSKAFADLRFFFKLRGNPRHCPDLDVVVRINRSHATGVGDGSPRHDSRGERARAWMRTIVDVPVARGGSAWRGVKGDHGHSLRRDRGLSGAGVFPLQSLTTFQLCLRRYSPHRRVRLGHHRVRPPRAHLACTQAPALRRRPRRNPAPSGALA